MKEPNISLVIGNVVFAIFGVVSAIVFTFMFDWRLGLASLGYFLVKASKLVGVAMVSASKN